jgi:hypothetical protein
MSGPPPVDQPPVDKPTDPGWVAAPDERIRGLARYLADNAERFTPEALRQAAMDAGYTPDEIEEALARVRAAATVGPIRTRARWIVLGAYAVVWLLFASIYLTRSYAYGMGPVLQGVLTVALLIALGLSLLWLRSRRPDPTDLSRALAVFLVVPVILLIGVAGLCVPFLGSR